MSLKQSLTHCWQLDENNDEKIFRDIVGHKHGICDVNTSVVSTTGKLNTAMKSYVAPDHHHFVVEASQGIKGTSEITVSFWIKILGELGASDISDYIRNGDLPEPYLYQWWIKWHLLNTFFLVCDEGAIHPYCTRSASDIDDGNWHLVVCTYKAGTPPEMYVWHDNDKGGSLVGVTGGNIYGPLSSSMGVVDDDNSDVVIDEICVWTRVLTDEEVGELWNDGDGADPTDGLTLDMALAPDFLGLEGGVQL
jgi:hypothetical protein